jgi:hypothetical protein
MLCCLQVWLPAERVHPLELPHLIPTPTFISHPLLTGPVMTWQLIFLFKVQIDELHTKFFQISTPYLINSQHYSRKPRYYHEEIIYINLRWNIVKQLSVGPLYCDATDLLGSRPPHCWGFEITYGYRPLGFQEVEASTIYRQLAMTVVWLSALLTGHFYSSLPKEIPLVQITVRGWVDPNVRVPERLRINRNRDLPVCSAVPQPTAPPYTPSV